MTDRFRIGVVFPQTEIAGSPGDVRLFATEVERMGFDHLLIYDHVVGAEHADRVPPLVGPYTERDPFHDPFVLTAHLAAATTRLHFASAVLILPQRETALVALQAAEVAALTRHRFRLGVGIGWNWTEYDALGRAFATRGRRLDQQLPLLARLWSEPCVTFEGDLETTADLAVGPVAAAPPVWLGGFSDAAYRRAARLADGFFFGGSLSDAERARRQTLELVDAAGRSSTEFGSEYVVKSRTVDPGEIASKLERWARSGASHGSVSTMHQGWTTAEQHLERLGRIARQIGICPA